MSKVSEVEPNKVPQQNMTVSLLTDWGTTVPVRVHDPNNHVESTRIANHSLCSPGASKRTDVLHWDFILGPSNRSDRLH